MMDAASIFIARKLTERIQDKQAALMEPLINGQATDFADYKDRAGYLRALKHVLEWMAEVRFDEEERR